MSSVTTRSSRPPAGGPRDTQDPPKRRPKDDTRIALIFIAPAALGLAVFLIWPLIRGIWLSFTNYNLLTPAEFVGLANYRRLIADPIFWDSMKTTVYYVLLNIGIQTAVAMVIALLMYRLTQSTLLRGLVLTPYLVSNVVAALVWVWILDTQFGVGNQILGWLGIDPIGFFTDSAWAIPTIALVNVWRHMGYTALLIFAGLQTLPPSVYEAARLDGAGEIRTFFSVTLPLLRPIMALVLIMTIIGSFQVFDTVAITTGGGPANATNVLQLYIYDMAFDRFQFGYASAMSVGLLIVLGVITAIQYRLSRADSSDMS
ncbi:MULTISPECIES: carbohydrate ABC transporter permease [Kocuria]|uniref:Sugar ABC transporter permease n=1 Tax=Kocuria subflava TaxID=1736139 RepID=A0A846U6K1_9MICC|nr:MULTISPECIES: sugar ABC transporter permease [Kocuria]NKE10421.1 sugar ABC transporter permease [Kocuria subflava]